MFQSTRSALDILSLPTLLTSSRPPNGAQQTSISKTGNQFRSMHAGQDAPMSARRHEVASRANPVWDATVFDFDVTPEQLVSIHAPRERPYQVLRSGRPHLVSIHAPAWARQNRGASMSKNRFQSTRPRGARPGGCFGERALSIVSIHAPAGADDRRCGILPNPYVSIHAPAWARLVGVVDDIGAHDVSIHAPRGARQIILSAFNSV